MNDERSVRDSAHRTSSAGNTDTDIPLLTFVNVLLRNRALFSAVLVFTVLVLVLGGLLLGGYRTRTVFTPVTNNQSSLGDVASLAARFGVNVPGGVSTPVGLYAALPTTDGLLSQLAQTRFSFPKREGGDTVSALLVDLLGVKGHTADERLRNAVDKLRKKVKSVADLGTGTVVIQTYARWPALSEQMARRLLDLINVFNVDKLQSQARAERAFVEERMLAAQRELEDAENRLELFQTTNRSYQTSPKLTIEAGRLQRRIDLRQQTYTTLVTEYEQARIQEIRNTPVITVVDPPEGASRVRFKVGFLLLLGLLLGVVFGTALAFVREYFIMLERERSSELSVFQGLLRALARDLRLDRWARKQESRVV